MDGEFFYSLEKRQGKRFEKIFKETYRVFEMQIGTFQLPFQFHYVIILTIRRKRTRCQFLKRFKKLLLKN